MSVSLEKKTMLEAFKQKKAPTLFLSSMFRTSERDMMNSTVAVIDIKRNNELIAIDVVRGTGGFRNTNNRFTTKEYTPPMYDEWLSYNESQLNERMPGMDPFTNPDYSAHFLALITDDQARLSEKIMRAIELQASNALFSGTVPLVNGETVDYKQKASHQIDVGTAWSDPDAPVETDIDGAAEVNRKDGLVESKMLIMGKTAHVNFMANNAIKEKINFRRASLADIRSPLMNVNGATFHGLVSINSYEYEIWTYPQFYQNPTDAELDLPSGTIANPGSVLPYVPDTKVLVMPRPEGIDLRLIWAGIPQLVDRVSPQLQALGLSRIPGTVRGDFVPYAMEDDKAQCVIAGIRSAPLCVPTQIDGWSVLETAP